MKNKIMLKGLDHPVETFQKLQPGEITNIILDLGKECNFRCVYCGNSDHSKNNSPSLSLEERKRVISEARELGAKTVFFAGEGEPTLDRDFKELIQFNYDNGLTTIVYSNISLIDRNLASKLNDNDVSLVIKIDSLNKEVYNQIVGTECFERFKQGLTNIQEAYGNQKVLNSLGISRIEVSTVVNKLNYLELPFIQEFCRDNGYIFCCKTPGKKGSADKAWELLVGDQEKELSDIASRFTDREQTTANIEGKCSISTYGISVTRTGDVAMCESIREPYIGNVKQHSLDWLILKKQEIFKQYGCPACIAKYIKNGPESTKMFS
jgi:MoaA/NifB/PqqE/SkfB family radical SAM enzyme